jgi:DNA helicase-2/ATP-dependent DNA helicase PcrA
MVADDAVAGLHRDCKESMIREFSLKPFVREHSLQIDYQKELNPQQLEAVTAPPGPALVIAGAGSGKTRTLTYRVAYLLEQGIPPDRILLLTFTNKAAKEMMRRIHDVLGYDLTTLWGGTFHSIGHRILRRHAECLGYRKDFTILDREDTEDLIKDCVVEAEIDTTSQLFPTPAVLAGIFSMATNNSLTLREALRTRFQKIELLEGPIQAVWAAYAKRKQTNNVVDFDDLLILWLKLLKEHQEIRELYQRRFQFILVDEYQDTNGVQSGVVDLIAEKHHNIMVVGDDSQCIYSWRGANFRNIMEFPTRYSESKIYKIEQNYRSTPEILEFANAAIAANVHQFSKHLVSARRSGVKPAIVQCPDSRSQAQFIAQRVLELRDEGFVLKETAVLYRSHFHALELQLELRARGIAFQITSGIRFFEQAHVKDVAAFLRWVVNPSDELAFKRLTGLLPGIGPKAAHKVWLAF